MPTLLSSAQVKKERRQRRARNNRSYEKDFFVIRQIPASILYIQKVWMQGFLLYILVF
nr:MAG TPA: hypothetical protein [Caudoviricetes sp.]